MRATDRAREVLSELDRYARFPELRQARRDIIPAALDFADAVEAAYDESEDSGELISLVIRAHTAFLAQLDRATGGGA